jgi:hypothetical protein
LFACTIVVAVDFFAVVAVVERAVVFVVPEDGAVPLAAAVVAVAPSAGTVVEVLSALVCASADVDVVAPDTEAFFAPPPHAAATKPIAIAAAAERLRRFPFILFPPGRNR